MASRTEDLKRNSHEVSLQETGETWNSVAIYTNFSIPEKENNVPWPTLEAGHETSQTALEKDLSKKIMQPWVYLQISSSLLYFELV